MNTSITPIKLFITGATGYIGGSFLTKLLESSQVGKWDITVLTRSEATVPKFKALGVTPLLGALEDDDILTQAAIDADVVLNFADCDNLPATKSLLKGLNTGGKRRILIHTSGTGELTDGAKGNYPTDEIYSDLNLEKIHALPITQIHKDVDDYIFENNQNFESIIVAPPCIYGRGSGISNQISIQLPILIKGYIKAGYVGTIGKGINIWSHVHIDDLSDFYILLLEKALAGKASTGKDGWYFCESGEHTWIDVAEKIGQELVKQKVIQDATVGEFTPEEVDQYLGKFAWAAIGGNSRARADRARELGWKPQSQRESIFESIENEVKFILEQQRHD